MSEPASTSDPAGAAQPKFEQLADEPDSRLLAYLQLMRLPNVFTAMADILLGYLVLHRELQPPAIFAALIASSSLLYLAGMVLNDVFDVAQDRQERPGRPIPSGRVSLSAARSLGWSLLIAGVAAGALAAGLAGQWRPAAVAVALAGAVLAYDKWLKRTPLGPLGMGTCRFFNVLLGASSIAGPLPFYLWVLAGGLGIYIAGVTWFARSEANISGRSQLFGGLCLMLAGLGTICSYPLASDFPFEIAGSQWVVAWSVFGLIVANRSLRAVFDPRPATVQVAVKMSILAIVVIDAMASFAALGEPYWPLVIVSLLLPAALLGRWVYST